MGANGPVLVLSATAGELAPLRALLAEPSGQARTAPFASAQRPPAPWWDVTYGRLAGVGVALASTGIGKVNAAAGTAVALSTVRPSHVVLVGIAGAYPGSGLALGAVAVATSETHLDSGVGEGAAWQGLESIGFPLLATEPPTYNRIELDHALATSAATAAGATALPFATGEAVTGSPERARMLELRHGAAVESMEGAAVAQVAVAHGVPFVELRAVSNVVGVRDKSAWRIAEAIENACAAAALVVTAVAASRGREPREVTVRWAY
ncbi:MAG: futalosine hydrolase [Trueperaceae bacterium]|nr:futalosine hydrolase [Trueperaceae bacterium]MCO5174086.1 futalosine hydrolase [Trueperaceae bacterium]MCW5820090.1 futalosine hydrolase [Trueperaceae bacterium]